MLILKLMITYIYNYHFNNIINNITHPPITIYISQSPDKNDVAPDNIPDAVFVKPLKTLIRPPYY